MASSPQFKVFVEKEYVAAFKHAEDAAMFVAARGSGVVRLGHSGPALWHEGHEAISAGESYDEAAATMLSRMAR